MKITDLLPAALILLAGVAANFLAMSKVDGLRVAEGIERQAVVQLRRGHATLPAGKPAAPSPAPGPGNEDFDADEWIGQFVKKKGNREGVKPKLKPRMVEKLEECFDIGIAGMMEQLKQPGAGDAKTMPFFIAALLYAEKEPKEALALAADENISNEFLESAFAVLAKRDLRLAWDWVTNHGHGQGEGMLHTGPTKNLEGILATHMADRDPALFADYAVSFDNDQRMLDMFTFATVLADRDKIHAAWNALRDHESITRERSVAIDNAYLKYLSWKEGAPAAAKLLDAEIDYQDEEARTLSIAQIARAAQRHDATEAADWLLAYGDDVSAYRILPGFVREWSGSDFNGAGEWLGRLPPSPIRDAAVAEFVSTIRHVNPDAANTWADTIQDPDIKNSLLEEKD